MDGSASVAGASVAGGFVAGASVACGFVAGAAELVLVVAEDLLLDARRVLAPLEEEIERTREDEADRDDEGDELSGGHLRRKRVKMSRRRVSVLSRR